MHIWISALQNVFLGLWLFWGSGSHCSQCLCCDRGYVRFAEWHLLCLCVAGAAASAAVGNTGHTVKTGDSSVEKLSSHLSHVSQMVSLNFFFLNVSCSSIGLFSVRTSCVLQLGHLSFWILSKEWSPPLSKKKTCFCFNLWNLKINFLSCLKIVSCKQRHVSLEEKLFSQSKH